MGKGRPWSGNTSDLWCVVQTRNDEKEVVSKIGFVQVIQVCNLVCFINREKCLCSSVLRKLMMLRPLGNIRQCLAREVNVGYGTIQSRTEMDSSSLKPEVSSFRSSIVVPKHWNDIFCIFWVGASTNFFKSIYNFVLWKKTKRESEVNRSKSKV